MAAAPSVNRQPAWPDRNPTGPQGAATFSPLSTTPGTSSKLYRRVFERISGTLEVCRIDVSLPSVWWTGCGAASTDSENYEKGKKRLTAAMGM